jgi:DNA-binding beta-propeller fold protein YncE
LPSGTYYYILDTNSEAGKFKGSVSIIRWAYSAMLSFGTS